MTPNMKLCRMQATKEDFAYRHAHSKMTQNFRVTINPWPGLACHRLAWLSSMLCTLQQILLLLRSMLLCPQVPVDRLPRAMLSALQVSSGHLGVQVGGEKDHAFNRARYERLLREHSRYQRYLHIPAAEAP